MAELSIIINRHYTSLESCENALFVYVWNVIETY